MSASYETYLKHFAQSLERALPAQKSRSLAQSGSDIEKAVFEVCERIATLIEWQADSYEVQSRAAIAAAFRALSKKISDYRDDYAADIAEEILRGEL